MKTGSIQSRQILAYIITSIPPCPHKPTVYRSSAFENSSFSFLIVQAIIKPMNKLISTYSITAVDPAAGEMGVAVQSHFFSVGSAVPWLRPGVGAVATQSMVNLQFGPDGLSLLEKGFAPRETVAQLIAQDQGRSWRQLAVIDASGEAAAWTGEKCIREAGHLTGPGYSLQANMMLKPGVPEAMRAAYLSSKGLLSSRMLAALVAAQAAGGDIRGRQSAAMTIVSTTASGIAEEERILDLRVEDNPDPLQELARLLALHEGYRMLEKGDNAVSSGNPAEAAGYYRKAEAMVPDKLEPRFWHGVGLLQAGLTEKALSLLEPIFFEDPRWKELLLRLPEADLLKLDEKTMKLFRGSTG
jgi:uncharacterized Ntn-hydrolase superfamily protein